MLRIGFVALIRPLFKGDSPRLVRESLAALTALGQAWGFTVVTPTVTNPDRHLATGQEIPSCAVSSPETAQQAARQLAESDLDLLLIQHATFATGELLAPLVNAAQRVGVWALPEPEVKSGPLPLNALCGLTMTLSLLKCPQVGKHAPVKWFYGPVGEERFQRRLLPTVAALRGLKALEAARILQIGGTAPGFYGLEERPELSGVTVETRPLQALFERVAAVPERAAQARAKVWLKEAAGGSGVNNEQLMRAARLELALAELAREGDYHALALRCWPELPEACGAMACAAVGRLGDQAIPAACEGDVMGALSMLAVQGVSAQPAMLMDLSDLDAHDDSLLFWHCGNAPLSWAGRSGARLASHFNRELGVVRDMTIKPGPATGFRLLAGGRRALVFTGRFAGSEKPGFDGVRGWLSELRWAGTALGGEAFVHNLLDHRLPHHAAFGEGAWGEALLELCAWLGAEPLPFRPPRPTL